MNARLALPLFHVHGLGNGLHCRHASGCRMRLLRRFEHQSAAATFLEFRPKFGHTILERYGMSENLMRISNPHIGERRPGSVGLPLPGVSARILDSSGQPVADGETGERYL